MKRGQSALEFVILVSFMLLVFFSFFLLIKNQILDVSTEKDRTFLQEVNELVVQQALTASQTQGDVALNFSLPLSVQPYFTTLPDEREIVSRFGSLEYVNFFPFNVSGDIVQGTYNDRNTLYKTDGYVKISDGNILNMGQSYRGVFLNFNPEKCLLATLDGTCGDLNDRHPNYELQCQTLNLCTGADPFTDITTIAEWGSRSVGDTWSTINLVNTYIDPVVLISPVGYTAIDSATIAVRNVQADSFEVEVRELDIEDGTHVSETIYYFVIESGSHIVDGKHIQAGTLAGRNAWVTQELDFVSQPVVLTNLNTDDESTLGTAFTRVRAVSPQQFEVIIQQQESLLFDHDNETIGWVAFDQGVYDQIDDFTVGLSSRIVNSSWTTLTHGASSPSAFVAGMQSYFDIDPGVLRYRNFNTNTIDLFVQEETSIDSETTHAQEIVGYAVFE